MLLRKFLALRTKTPASTWAKLRVMSVLPELSPKHWNPSDLLRVKEWLPFCHLRLMAQNELSAYALPPCVTMDTAYWAQSPSWKISLTCAKLIDLSLSS